MDKRPIFPQNAQKVQPAKPFLKWAGGKGQLLNQFRELYPAELKAGKIKNYYEPFLGGGAVFFDIRQNFRFDNSILYDINEELILVYRVIQKNSDRLIKLLKDIEDEYLKLDNGSRKLYYYRIREEFNNQKNNWKPENISEISINRAAQTVFLNKTCYNGLFRFNNKGGFNTPAGDYKNPTICDSVNIFKVSELLQGSEIKCVGFEQVLNDVNRNSFVYFDPPYRPLSKTASFTAYSKQVFNDDDQRRLAKVFTQLDKKGCKLMLSNSDPKNTDKNDDFFDELYAGYNIKRIPARRNINSKSTGRGQLNEIIVTNY